MNSDEALARLLQQEWAEEEEVYKADLALAKQLQDEFVIDLTQSSSSPLPPQQKSDLALAYQLSTIVDESILEEETPDLHQLFSYFNRIYFNNQLSGVEVKWSTRMTRCAGTCTYKRLQHHCIVALSEPILKFRPKKDMFETLLHEMIHALLFITKGNEDRDGHGPEFLSEAKRISDAAGVKITVFHNFHDEVDYYLTHVWRCNGICQERAPYFGIVKRSVNRPPQPADTWYAEHQLTCGGTYTKIASPPPKEPSSSSSSSSTKKRKTHQTSTLEN
ncbi:SprT-like family-domain-containing protein, partial [Pilaira anomala]